MSATITANAPGAGTTTPLTILSPYGAQIRSRNVVHDLIGGGISVSLVQPRPRAGELRLLYETEAAADAALRLHYQEATFTLVESDRPTLNMTYAVDGDLAIELDDQTLEVWIVTIGYQEIVV